MKQEKSKNLSISTNQHIISIHKISKRRGEVNVTLQRQDSASFGEFPRLMIFAVATLTIPSRNKKKKKKIDALNVTGSPLSALLKSPVINKLLPSPVQASVNIFSTRRRCL